MSVTRRFGPKKPEPPKGHGEVVHFKPRENSTTPHQERKATIANLLHERERYVAFEREIRDLRSESSVDMINPINFVTHLNDALDEMPRSLKVRYRTILIAMVQRGLSYSKKYPVKTHFEFLEDHLKELRKLKEA
ncbi:MAG: hypothetical protein PHH82_01110 [Candidatus ainarchaeum sp.]|nr:hypothetical protein [Candidatus ainarchaeum sp.]